MTLRVEAAHVAIDIRRALAIPGWMEPFELQWLAEMASVSRTVIEVGAWKGRSTRVLADHCPGTVYVVDNWCDASERQDLRNQELLDRGPTQIEADWHSNLRDHELEGRVVLVRGHSPAMAPIVYRQAGGVDLAFIDADHNFEGVVNDIEAYRSIVTPGGILAGHDYTTTVHPGVRKAVDFIFGREAHQGPGSIWWVRV